MKTKLKIKLLISCLIVGSFLLNGCGEKSDKVIEEMTLKGTVDRGQKTIDKVKKIQQDYEERLKDYQASENPTNKQKTEVGKLRS